MKKAMRTTFFKACCFILCAIFAVLAPASALGVYALVEGEVYTTGKGQLLDDCYRDIFYSDARQILYKASLSNEELSFSEVNSTLDNETNLRYVVKNISGEVLLQGSNFSQDESCDLHCVAQLVSASDGYFEYSHWEVFNGEWTDDFLKNFDLDSAENIYIVSAYLEQGLPVNDEYRLNSTLVDVIYALRYHAVWITAVSALLAIALFITLMCIAGHRPNDDELYPGPLYRVPFDVLTALAFFTIFLFMEFVDSLLSYSSLVNLAMWALFVLITLNVVLGLCMSAAVRLKKRELFSGTLFFIVLSTSWSVLKAVWHMVRHFVRKIPLVRKAALCIVAAFILNLCIIWLIAGGGTAMGVALALIEMIALGIGAIYVAMFMKQLQLGGEALANGDLSYTVDTKMMPDVFKKHGENLNSISLGMATAVEKRLQSERLKTELITNVSHDIKTPLTSIINYASLIGQESCTDDKRLEYAEVLVRKSEHLKRLLDDLVEASKATTGNLDVSLLPCDAVVLLEQVAGEFEQKFASSGLQLIVDYPKDELRVMLDSRRIWRVFENLMINACKYSLRGSRVYLNLAKDGENAIFTLRNTSNVALNISPEELMERFVRGDSARSTDGNGLGLSIARSLTELQGGKMDITIDGDLFKVTLQFPVIR